MLLRVASFREFSFLLGGNGNRGIKLIEDIVQLRMMEKNITTGQLTLITPTKTYIFPKSSNMSSTFSSPPISSSPSPVQSRTTPTLPLPPLRPPSNPTLILVHLRLRHSHLSHCCRLASVFNRVQELRLGSRLIGSGLGC